MTPIELHRLAGAVTCLRPDWPPASIQTFLQRHLAHRPLRDIAVALVTCALDPQTDTPARVLEPGPWWKTAAAQDIPRPRNTCPDHPLARLRTDNTTGETTCADCHADRQAVTEPQPLRRRGVPPSDAQRRQMRAAITAIPDDATSASEAT